MEKTTQAHTQNKFIIGITGGIGAGKTSVARILTQNGVPVYNSDLRAKQLATENQNLKNEIIKLLGENAFKNGKYNTEWVAKKVFQNEKILNQLNEIIHPQVQTDFRQWCQKQKEKILCKETALLFELKLNLSCYKTILICAEENLRIERIMKRDARSREEIQNIISKQLPDEKKMKLADFVIFNNGNINELETRIKEIINQIKITIK